MNLELEIITTLNTKDLEDELKREEINETIKQMYDSYKGSINVKMNESIDIIFIDATNLSKEVLTHILRNLCTSHKPILSTYKDNFKRIFMSFGFNFIRTKVSPDIIYAFK